MSFEEYCMSFPVLHLSVGWAGRERVSQSARGRQVPRCLAGRDKAHLAEDDEGDFNVAENAELHSL